MKTLDEFIRDELHARMSLASTDIAKAVQPVFFATDRGRLEHLGSCILIHHKSRHLLITAAHVIDANKVSSLYILVRGKTQKLEGAGLMTVAPLGIRERDKFDFSIIELPSDLVSALGPIRYVQEAELQMEAIRGRPIMAFGYPNSKNKQINHKERKIASKRFSYGGTLYVPEMKGSATASSENHLLRMKYEKKSRTVEGLVVNSIEPRGISGGGLFDLGKIDLASLTSNDRPRLVGLLIERRRNEKAIVATSISTVLSSL